GVFSPQSCAAHALVAGRVRRIVGHSTASRGIGGAVMERQLLLRYARASLIVLLGLRGFASAQTSTPIPMRSPTPSQVDRLKVAVQLEREQNDPLLMTLVFASQYAPVYEALVEEDPWHQFVPMLATDWHMSPDGKTWTFNLRRGVQWHFGWGAFTAKDVVHTLQRHVRSESMSGQVTLMKELLEHVEVVHDYQIIFAQFIAVCSGLRL